MDAGRGRYVCLRMLAEKITIIEISQVILKRGSRNWGNHIDELGIISSSYC